LEKAASPISLAKQLQVFLAAFGILLAIQLITIFWFWFASTLLKKTSCQPVSNM
jgi:hypothetical protein